MKLDQIETRAWWRRRKILHVTRSLKAEKVLDEIEHQKREVKENLKKKELSFVSITLAEKYKEPESVKHEQMTRVELQLYEDLGQAAEIPVKYAINTCVLMVNF